MADVHFGKQVILRPFGVVHVSGNPDTAARLVLRFHLMLLLSALGTSCTVIENKTHLSKSGARVGRIKGKNLFLNLKFFKNCSCANNMLAHCE